MKRSYTVTEIASLYRKALNYKYGRKYRQALIVLNFLIKNNPTPDYYRTRAHIYGDILDFNRGIADFKSSLNMDPDHATTYSNLGGYLVSNEIKRTGKIGGVGSKSILNVATEYYLKALEKDPLNECGWINLIEVSIFAGKWDDAISYYGACRSGISSMSSKLMLAFLGNLVLIISGEECDKNDMKIMLDTTIRITSKEYRLSEGASYINELASSGFDPIKIVKVKELLRMFISHYDDEPCRYYPPQKKTFKYNFNGKGIH